VTSVFFLPMTSYIIRRLLLLFPTLLGITIVTFLVMALSPGGMKAIVANREGTMDPKQRAAVRAFYEKKYGLDKPLPVQYLKWLNHVTPVGVKEPGAGWPRAARFGFKAPDLGESINARRPVLDMIEESLPITLLLNVVTLPIFVGISIWSGIVAARNRGGLADVGGGTLLLGLFSVPQIWAGVLLIGFLANKEILHWFPAGGLHDLRSDSMAFLPTFSGGFQRGWLLDTAWHLVLPGICFSYAQFAFTSKLTRSRQGCQREYDRLSSRAAKRIAPAHYFVLVDSAQHDRWRNHHRGHLQPSGHGEIGCGCGD